jgi:hypothetical protein
MYDLMQPVFQHSLKRQVVAQLFKSFLLVLEHTQHQLDAKPFGCVLLAPGVAALEVALLYLRVLVVEQQPLALHF